MWGSKKNLEFEYSEKKNSNSESKKIDEDEKDIKMNFLKIAILKMHREKRNQERQKLINAKFKKRPRPRL